MAQAINRIHIDNNVNTSYDDRIYQYSSSGEVWRKSNISLYKVFDRELSVDEIQDLNVDDVILTYKTVSNSIKNSEIYTKKSWVLNNLVSNLNPQFKVPGTCNNITKIQSFNPLIENVPHYITQQFMSKPNKLMVYSAYVKKEEGSGTSNIALTFYIDTYATGISAKFDIDDLTGYDENGIKQVQISSFDKNYTENTESSNKIKNDMKHLSAYIQKLAIQDEMYFRIWLIGQIPFYTQNSVRLYLLNNAKNYVYSASSSESKYIINITGFQLQFLDVMDVTQPCEYITTKDEKEIILRILKNYRKISISGSTKYITQPLTNTLTYLDDVKEKIVTNGNDYFTILESSVPRLENPQDNDIAVVKSIISFSNYTDAKNNVKEDNCVILGENYAVSDPLNAIYYDESTGKYRIKMENGYIPLLIKTNKKTREAIVKAMTYNQGYFETWSQQGKCDFKYGYNTGGGYNFWKLHKISKTL